MINLFEEDEKNKALIRETIGKVLCEDFGFCSAANKPEEKEKPKEESEPEPHQY